MPVNVDVAVSYQLDRDKVPAFYTKPFELSQEEALCKHPQRSRNNADSGRSRNLLQIPLQ